MENIENLSAVPLEKSNFVKPVRLHFMQVRVNLLYLPISKLFQQTYLYY